MVFMAMKFCISECSLVPCAAQLRAKTSSPFPVSRNDFMLERTRGQPKETLLGIFELALNLSCVTVRHTMLLIFSISKVTRDSSFRSSGSAHVNTRRLAGMHSITLPTTQASPSLVTCSHFEPFFQSETFASPAQY